ncbi:hypothetical protein, partial [Streptococcus sp. DD11]|uniref:hypothetical protein n=1 Tax=Streptococcus sp. DD11 TaxID=1777879 RepID=UPI0019D2CB86
MTILEHKEAETLQCLGLLVFFLIISPSGLADCHPITFCSAIYPISAWDMSALSAISFTFSSGIS